MLASIQLLFPPSLTATLRQAISEVRCSLPLSLPASLTLLLSTRRLSRQRCWHRPSHPSTHTRICRRLLRQAAWRERRLLLLFPLTTLSQHCNTHTLTYALSVSWSENTPPPSSSVSLPTPFLLLLPDAQMAGKAWYEHVPQLHPPPSAKRSSSCLCTCLQCSSSCLQLLPTPTRPNVEHSLQHSIRCCHLRTLACSIRQHTSAYVSIRQHTSAYACHSNTLAPCATNTLLRMYARGLDQIDPA
jgi:hypothetical protein